MKFKHSLLQLLNIDSGRRALYNVEMCFFFSSVRKEMIAHVKLIINGK